MKRVLATLQIDNLAPYDKEFKSVDHLMEYVVDQNGHPFCSMKIIKYDEITESTVVWDRSVWGSFDYSSIVQTALVGKVAGVIRDDSIPSTFIIVDTKVEIDWNSEDVVPIISVKGADTIWFKQDLVQIYIGM